MAHDALTQYKTKLNFSIKRKAGEYTDTFSDAVQKLFHQKVKVGETKAGSGCKVCGGRQTRRNPQGRAGGKGGGEKSGP